MRKGFYIILLITLILMWGMDGFAQQNPTVEERLIRLEEGQKSLSQRMDDLKGDMNRRFEDMNRRFEDMNRRFDDQRFWLQMIFGVLVVVIGSLIAQWLMMWRRLIRVDITVADHLRETEKDRLLALQRERLEALEARLARLEAAGRT